MLVRCPTCASGYDLAPELLHEGRVLRCAHCRDAWAHSWARGAAPASARVAPTGAEIVAEVRSGRRPQPAEPVPASATRRRALPRGLRSALAVAAAGAVVAGGMAVVAAKERVVSAFPASAAVFATLGLPVNLRGLSLAGLRSVVEAEGGAATLTLDGRITNLRAESLPVPGLRIAVRDRTGREIYYWTAPAPKPRLAAGETVPFHARLSTPPREGETLAVTFVPAAAGPRRVAEAGPPAR